MKSCQVIASDKYNLTEKSWLSFRKWFASYRIVCSFGGRITCYNSYILCLQMSTIIFGTSQNKCLIGLYYQNIFPTGGLTSLWSRGFIIFQRMISKWLLSNSKLVNTCEDKKRRQVVPVLEKYLEKFDIKNSRLVLSILAWCEKKAYSATGMDTNLRIFLKSQM